LTRIGPRAGAARRNSLNKVRAQADGKKKIEIF